MSLNVQDLKQGLRELMLSEPLRLAQKLPSIDPTTRDYEQLLRNIEALLGVRQFCLDALEQALDEAEKEGNVIPFPVQEDLPPEVKEPEPEAAKEPEPEAAKEPEPEAAPAAEQKTYDKAQVREALAKAKNERSVDVHGLIDKFGYDNFSAVPASKYGELMALIEKA